MTIDTAVERLFARDVEAWEHGKRLLEDQERDQTGVVLPEALFFRLVALACCQNGYTATLGTLLDADQLEMACAHLDARCEDVVTTLMLSRRTYSMEHSLAVQEQAAALDLRTEAWEHRS